ncbi:hypothetical protein [Billgrantia gudaonensis]|uniref:DUF2946 domain-containing protein n=1 Tax=Billgrantia gudaonensis TaxID=376427 RepID=A0A1G8MKS3_9GAMM|nr:hypothetical protein [Halomonas gudaonensis]SDI68446.1 hypothetical protein SAMN04487954_10134 [Halomonas gudaonensis]
MTQLATSSPSRSAGGRLLALLVALLLAMASLPGHAGMDLENGHGDCLTPHVQMPDGAATDPAMDASDPPTDAVGCSACSALARGMQLALADPASPAIAPAVAFVARSPQPPRRPPKA